ncbi:MAG: hypothetical protein EPO21_18945 [Chloroflexota bacterium]|nr:MAG: hypothetical protein EPO21_18945 [Chloroflexota bacterium]
MTTTIEIPTFLEGILARDTQLRGAVDLSLQAFKALLEDNKTVFFPEYTDHGIDHVEGVMRAAAFLIRDPAGVITAEDAAVLVLACLLHDVAMHLTKDGFVRLVSTNQQWRIVEKFKDEPWNVLWADYVMEAKRFDGRALQNLFGSPDPINIPDLKEPQLWTEEQLKLIGEFIRRHHHRLAHQIAINGMPGPTSGQLAPQGFDDEFNDIAGVVARSHGMPLRGTFDYLRTHYNERQYRQIHPVFLMAVVRVADYLQVEATRAPEQLLSVKSLRSPISAREWSAHQAIKDARTDADVESLFVHCKPDGVGIYLRLKELLTGIQSELDSSWAVLGELYSRYTTEGLDTLGLTIRRVTSNLDDEEGFAQQVEYFPRRAAFDVAGVEVMKLLVEPLYGKEPAIGVRELVQNAVDAVRELDEYLRIRGDKQDVVRACQEADVIITLKQESDGSFWLVVSDRGIGMTADTIQNYFLKAGATLRRSASWRKVFETEEGNSRVLRSGRFGVGVFATFLLGDRISVSTRHPDEEVGVEFEASIDDEVIELGKANRDVGTTIGVKIDELVLCQLLEYDEDWDWYALRQPSVKRFVEIDDVTAILRSDQVRASASEWPRVLSCVTRTPILKTPLVQRSELPESGSLLSPGWRRITYSGFQDIQWTYGSAPPLTCNGIIIVQRNHRPSTTLPVVRPVYEQLNLAPTPNLHFSPPSCSCFDPNGLLPLNLRRNGLTRQFPFQQALLESMLDDFLAFVLVTGPTTPIGCGAMPELYLRARYPGFHIGPGPGHLAPLASAPEGITLCEPWLLQKCSSGQIVLLGWDTSSGTPQSNRDLELEAALKQQTVTLSESFTAQDAANYASKFQSSMHDIVGWQLGSIFMRRDLQPNPRLPLDKPLWQNDGWTLVSLTDATENTQEFQRLMEMYFQQGGNDFPYIFCAQLFRKESQIVRTPLISQRWMEVLQTPVIPYDRIERRQKLAHAYDRLRPYIEAWEAESQLEIQRST